MDCIFCKILDKKIPSEFVYEDGELSVFRDINPKAPVHVLIVPKKHIESVNHLESGDAGLVGRMFIAAKQVAETLGTGDGYKLQFNVGRKGGQLVDHIHLHLLGGWDK